MWRLCSCAIWIYWWSVDRRFISNFVTRELNFRVLRSQMSTVVCMCKLYQAHGDVLSRTLFHKEIEKQNMQFEQNHASFHLWISLSTHKPSAASWTRHLMCVLNNAKVEKSLSCFVFRPLSHWPEGWNFDELIWLHNTKCVLSARSCCNISNSVLMFSNDSSYLPFSEHHFSHCLIWDNKF